MTCSQDATFMVRALQLAARGLYSTHPNPRVGAVLVRDGHVIGEGFHARAGDPHAEVLALRATAGDARGATAYVTLEPCCHQGRTPPCTTTLMDAGVARVVAAMQDPNPQVAGKGLAALQAAGIETAVGVQESAARDLNPGFVSRHVRGRPWVRVKTGMSLDGRSAMGSGESQWITGAAARQDVQKWRARSSAVITGVGTVRADDPALTVREGEFALPPGCAAPAQQPLRVVVDSGFRADVRARVFQGAGQALWAGVQSAAAQEPAPERVAVVKLGDTQGRVDLRALLEHLAAMECNEVLVEAGGTLAGSFLQAGLVDELIVYMAPTLLGHDARAALRLPGLERLADRVRLSIREVRQIGEDLRITAVPEEG